MMHAAHRLIKEDGQFACITACAAGGQVGVDTFNLLFPTYFKPVYLLAY